MIRRRGKRASYFLRLLVAVQVGQFRLRGLRWVSEATTIDGVCTLEVIRLARVARIISGFPHAATSRVSFSSNFPAIQLQPPRGATGEPDVNGHPAERELTAVERDPIDVESAPTEHLSPFRQKRTVVDECRFSDGRAPACRIL